MILFLGLNVGVDQLHVEAMLNEIVRDSASNVLSAIVLSDTYKARTFELWKHPGARLPMKGPAITVLKQIFQIKDFVPTGLVR